jgi:hypothetical protein
METTDPGGTCPPPLTIMGSRDGRGAADHDSPYQFGHRPSRRWTYPFTTRQYRQLLVLRGRVQDGAFADCGA